ncbi:acyl-CoA dehydrogenase family protein [Streptomyces sp. NPDC056411]|uniref:acyl-CoA dehydrogenase family protein n=1 Tax=Streptomyces sp. NPDC056411 TaxID=3345813 RepID=UPI0035DC215C
MAEPHPGTSCLLSDIETLCTVAHKRAEESDHNRALCPDVAEQLLESGFARYFVPAAHGGSQGSFRELAHALCVTSQACASAAWCGLIYATSGRMTAFLPEAGRTAVWRAGADRPIAAALAPAGVATPVDGGWRVSGEWGFLSGVDHSDWALVCVPGPVDTPGDPWFMALPRRDFAIRDTWFPVGMRGTGSNTLVAHDAFVPAGHAYRHEELVTASGAGPDAACFRVPLQAVAGLPFAALVVGIARGALDHWSSWAASRPVRNSESARLLMARSAAETDAAWLLVERAAQVADDVVQARRHAARNARDAAYAADLAKGVVNRLFEAAGSAAQHQRSPLQRAWRDIHAAASHATLRFDRHGTEFARSAWADDTALRQDIRDDGGRT